jgi:hypothetical protein
MVIDWSDYQTTRTKLPCKCQECGEIIYRSINKLDIQKTCYCKKCGNNIKRKQTNIERYGVEFPSQNEKIRKSGVNKWLKSFKDKRLNNKNYSMVVDWTNYKNARSKVLCKCQNCGKIITKTIESLNTTKDCYCKKCSTLLKTKETIKRKYGSDWYTQSKEFLSKIDYEVRNQKRYNTFCKNNSWKISSPELECYQKVIEKFSHVIRQYRDNRYPFACDFYILSEDLFIECNFHWTHGKEPFNEDKHKDIIAFWSERAKSSKYYSSAIEVWTRRDPLKLKTAKENNLNYKFFYTQKEFDEWFEKIGHNYL